jgi:hypothetical protein
LQLRAAGGGLRHQLDQPGEVLRQRIRPPEVRGGPASRGGGTARDVGAGGDAGGEAGDPPADAADPADDQHDHRPVEAASEAARGHGPAEPQQDGGEMLGGGAGWDGHAAMLLRMTGLGK